MNELILHYNEVSPEINCPKCKQGFNIEWLFDHPVYSEYETECYECSHKFIIKIYHEITYATEPKLY